MHGYLPVTLTLGGRSGTWALGGMLMPTGPPAEPPPVGSRGADDLPACPTKDGEEEPGTMVGDLDLLLTRALFTEA
jgi:hypothetical protein